MPVKTTEQKAERFVARVTRADKRIFQEAASLEGRSMATFVIAHAREAAEEIITRRRVVRLNAEDSRRFVEAFYDALADGKLLLTLGTSGVRGKTISSRCRISSPKST